GAGVQIGGGRDLVGDVALGDGVRGGGKPQRGEADGVARDRALLDRVEDRARDEIGGGGDGVGDVVLGEGIRGNAAVEVEGVRARGVARDRAEANRVVSTASIWAGGIHF